MSTNRHHHWVYDKDRLTRESMDDGSYDGLRIDTEHVEEVLFWESIGYESSEMYIPMGGGEYRGKY